MSIPDNDTQLWKGFNGHGLYAKRAERDVDGNAIDQTYVKSADVPALDDVLSTSTTTAITPRAVQEAVNAVDVIPSLPQGPSSLYSAEAGVMNWGGWETEEVEVPYYMVYYSDFSRFNTGTGEDTPIVGTPHTWSLFGNFTMEDLTISGETYKALHVNASASAVFSEDLCADFGDVISIEYTTYTPAYSGCWGGCYSGGIGNPSYNCWTSSRGIVTERGGTQEVIQRFNGFYAAFDSSEMADFYNPAAVNRIVTGGNTLIKSKNLVKSYIDEKKGIIARTANFGSMVSAYYGGWGSFDFYILSMKIYVGDRFDSMAGE
jgi:hypothetical protein